MPVNPVLKRLRAVIAATGLSQKQLVADGVATQSMLSRWLSEDTVVSTPALAQACRALKVSAHWILFEEGPMAAPGAAPAVEATFRAGYALAIEDMQRSLTILTARASGEGTAGLGRLGGDDDQEPPGPPQTKRKGRGR